MKIKFYWKKEQLLEPDFLTNVIVPKQTHSNNIVEIKTWNENLENCDGIFTSLKNNFKLWIKTADCACIVFYDKEKYGLIHAGWRWCVNWIVEKMLNIFENPNIFVLPFLHRFEIQKDFCYNMIFEKFGDKFFEFENDKIFFNFKHCLQFLLWEKAVFDSRNTFFDENLYSYRENKTSKRNYTIIQK